MDAHWNSLPTEIILSIVGNLHDTNDLKSLSKTSSKTYQTCVPALFSTVRLFNSTALDRFLHTVPKTYLRHIQSLDICTLSPCHSYATSTRTACSLVTLLSSCPRVEKLDLKLAGSPGTQLLSAFSSSSSGGFLSSVKHLTISNCLSEEDAPVSERVIVYVASSLPNLQSLSVSRITRSSMHASDLAYSYPCIPTVINDDDVPEHPILGSNLNLPSLLSIPSLKQLSIKDTHLGDPEWEEKSAEFKLDCLELGGHCLENEYENGMAIKKILNVVGESVKVLSLATALPPLQSEPSPPSPTSSFISFASSFDGSSSDAASSLPPSSPSQADSPRNITNIHIGPYVSLESLEDTLSHFSSSPVETVSISCFDPDLGDASKTVEDFLSLRVSRAESLVLLQSPESEGTFYGTLKHVDVVVIPENDVERRDDDDKEVRDLAEFCWDLGLVCRLRVEQDVEAARVKEWNGCAFS